MPTRIHPTAEISERAVIGDGTVIWHHAQVREGATLGRNCIIGKGAYIDSGVSVGDNVKIQNYASVYHGVTLEDGVFVGPYVCITNDLRPRAVNPDGSLKASDDWKVIHTLVRQGAALGASSTVICGITVGRWAMVGAGAVVTQDVPDYGLVWGSPARLLGFVCPCGDRLQGSPTQENEEDSAIGAVQTGHTVVLKCRACGQAIGVRMAEWARANDVHGSAPD